jgi:signal transduction histidine kinase
VVVAHAVTRALEAITALADERHVRLRYDVDATLLVRMARDDLHQVLLNLLDNAIKYGPVGQVVEVSAIAHDRTVRLAVRDQGAGVSPAEREAIWQPFHRGQAASRWDASGSGIGLVVVRDLVQRAGGRVFVDAPPEGQTRPGAVFVVELPPGT